MIAPRTSPGPLVGLVHLRALAITLVLLDSVGAFGWTGVDL